MTSGTIGDNCAFHDDCRLAVDNSTCDDVTKTCVCKEAYLSNENGTFCIVREYRPNQRRIQDLHSCSLEQCFLIFFAFLSLLEMLAECYVGIPLSVADPRGRQGLAPPLQSKFFHFMQFLGIFCKIISLRITLGSWQPSPWKSWILHCLSPTASSSRESFIRQWLSTESYPKGQDS